MQIKIIFDKITADKKLHVGWGVSFLIDEKILFDTGEKGPWLLENMQTLGVDIGKMESAVISHDHWDHTGGLWDVLKKKKGLVVYTCPHFNSEFKGKVKKLQGKIIEADKLKEISENIFVTGEIPGAYHGKYMPEQALVLKTKNGISIITGCAHPGILKIIEKIKAKFPTEPIYFVMGGFHLMEADKRAVEIIAENFRKMGITKIGPTHCTGSEAGEIFKKYYKGENFINIQVGQGVEV